MRYQLNMFGKYIARKGKKIFNDINEIPLYLFDVINESMHQLKGVHDPKQKILDSFHISIIFEGMSHAFKETHVRKVKIQLEESIDDEE